MTTRAQPEHAAPNWSNRITHATDVPLICDAPPGGLIIVTCNRALTVDQRMRLETIVRRGLNSGVLIVDGGFRVEHIPGRAWPDAEFCAA